MMVGYSMLTVNVRPSRLILGAPFVSSEHSTQLTKITGDLSKLV
jgi:hypothetical protein